MAGSIPVSSLVAVLIICIGIGLFCGTGYVGGNIVFDVFNDTSSEFVLLATGNDIASTTPEPEETFVELVEKVVKPVQISILAFSSFMVIEVVYFLFQAFMATAAINRTEYSKQAMLCGNKGWTGVSVVCSYLLTLLWVFILLGAFYCFLITFMLSSNPDPATINWATYGLKEREIQLSSGSGDKFKEQMRDAYIMFAICAGASLIVLIGMINLSMSHSANLAHLKTAAYWQQYNERRHEDQMELSSYTNHGAVNSTRDIPLNTYQ